MSGANVRGKSTSFAQMVGALMAITSAWSIALALLASGVLAGCYRSNGGEDGSVGFDGDAGLCEPLGSTRLCGRYCGLPCPRDMSVCDSLTRQVCLRDIWTEPDPRGEERCLADPGSDHEAYCYSGGICAFANDAPVSWLPGVCVSDEYCRWIRTQPGFEDVHCRYTDGTEFANGPPDDDCAGGAAPEDPFCGGRCGDTCPENPGASLIGVEVGSCIGRSETRGFGVCVAGSRDFRCWVGQTDTHTAIGNCVVSLYAISGMTHTQDCVCMLLGSAAMPEDGDHGWAVSEQTCLAYQARYPDQVRCLAETEL